MTCIRVWKGFLKFQWLDVNVQGMVMFHVGGMTCMFISGGVLDAFLVRQQSC